MISKRGLIVAGALGVGSALLASTSAFACQIGDFTVNSTAACDTSSATPQAAITVTDKDGSGTAATITVALASAPGTVLGTGRIENPTAQGVTTTITVPWQSGATYTVHVKSDRYNVDSDSSTHPAAPAVDCGTTPSAPAAPSTPAQPTPSKSASSTPSTEATSSPSQSASVAPAPAASQSSAGSSLAETGGGSNTTPMLGIAAALVIVGGGALIMVRRRSAGRHN
ncbi:LAETG motif-containing sortase-dependent surface protein [Streptantibioticus silvisoli]|uniref:LAETG motif-containing sortase-dependent surface protein n=1 Tax=Streptantibioticus silvisoli TaxID=2705255 RepID=A0ABT6VU46_9ACTN|nr:LAETG motif-containing sortase-dependent surface protein [Streptantibioticus silvisoli]MDI5962003.1 LAETG motif-containing sortase-dependent surface protein [Streptantibioticus silvisoli]